MHNDKPIEAMTRKEIDHEIEYLKGRWTECNHWLKWWEKLFSASEVLYDHYSTIGGNDPVVAGLVRGSEFALKNGDRVRNARDEIDQRLKALWAASQMSLDEAIDSVS